MTSSLAKQRDIVLHLKKRSTYPHRVSKKIKVEETHISWVFLIGPYAYKIKKALKFGKVLNFSTLELRKKSVKKK
jgi:aminoglycoside phosphotransferase family enzyme